MEKFVTRTKNPSIPRSSLGSSCPSVAQSPNVIIDVVQDNIDRDNVRVEKRARLEEQWVIISDSTLRKPIAEYDPLIRDAVMRDYVMNGPCQPLSHDFPQSVFGKQNRSFRKEWFNGRDWLEYSVFKDAAFCFWFYLFKGDLGPKHGDGVFVKDGCRNWRKAILKFNDHVGLADIQHNDAKQLFDGFRNQSQSISRRLSLANGEQSAAYRTRLTTSLDSARFLLAQGMPFWGHDESLKSKNRGNFMELIHFFGTRDKEIGSVVLSNAPANHQLTSPPIQKDISKACASETTKVILRELGDKFFSILVDEARDNSVKEQMAIVVRFVDDQGGVVERFLGVVHVLDTSAVSLKAAIDGFFAQHGLLFSKLRGQGYDGASNMKGEYNGLKSLILKENPCARYIHCFAHQLQLVIVGSTKKFPLVSDFFNSLLLITNMIGASCKRRDELRQIQHDELVEKLDIDDISTGRGLNQECGLARPGATRWGSHFTTINRLIRLWSATTKVLEILVDDGASSEIKGNATHFGEIMWSYQFVFIAHLVQLVLSWTNHLSQMLQPKDQNIIAAMESGSNYKEEVSRFAREWVGFSSARGE